MAVFFALSRALLRLSARRWTHHGLDLVGRNCGDEISHADQIVGGAGEGKNPVDFEHPAMAYLAHQRDGLKPAEAFLDPLSLSLAEGVASMSGGATINGASASS